MTHYNLLNTAYLDIHLFNDPAASKIICCPIPSFHIFGLIAGMLEPLVYGSKTIYPSLFPDTLAMMKAVHAEKCTAIKGAPIIFIDMMNHPDLKKYDMSSLEYMLLGASTIPKDLVLKMKHELKIKNILLGLGMTECS